MDPAKPKPKWSRKRWIAETFGSNLADFDTYQPGTEAREGRYPIHTDGTMYFAQMPTDSAAKVAKTLEGREWKATPSWKDPSVIIHSEV